MKPEDTNTTGEHVGDGSGAADGSWNGGALDDTAVSFAQDEVQLSRLLKFPKSNLNTDVRSADDAVRGYKQDGVQLSMLTQFPKSGRNTDAESGSR